MSLLLSPISLLGTITGISGFFNHMNNTNVKEEDFIHINLPIPDPPDFPDDIYYNKLNLKVKCRFKNIEEYRKVLRKKAKNKRKKERKRLKNLQMSV